MNALISQRGVGLEPSNLVALQCPNYGEYAIIKHDVRGKRDE